MALNREIKPMKYLIGFMILLFSCSSSLSTSYSDDYKALWEKVDKAEREGLPKSAFDTVEAIYAKAKKESAEDQLIKAIIYKVKLAGQFTDVEPAKIILDFESELSEIKQPASRAVFHSLLGELYHKYGMQNMYRFTDRTEILNETEADEDATKGKLEFKSLDEIQKKSLNHYMTSLTFDANVGLKEIEILTQNKRPKNLTIEANTVQEFVLYRAINHFSDDASFVSLDESNSAINDERIYAPTLSFSKMDFSGYDENNYVAQALKMYQKAMKLKSLSADDLVLLDLKRLEYVQSRARISDSDRLYETALKSIISASQLEATGLAKAKLIDHYLNLGDRYFDSKEESQKTAYVEAAALLKEAKDSDLGKYNDYIQKLQSRLDLKTLSIRSEKVILPNEGFFNQLTFRNIENVHCRIVKFTNEQFAALYTKTRQDEKLKYIKSLKAFKEWRVALPKVDDYNRNTIEITVEGLPKGHYVLLISNDNSFSSGVNKIVALSEIHVSQLSYFHTSGSGQTEVYIVDRGSGEPIPNAKIEVFDQSYNHSQRKENWQLIETLISDKNGYVSFNKNIQRFGFKITKDDDVLDLRQQHYNYGGRGERRSYNEGHVFTDRAIYRPGQLIYFKALLLKKDKKGIPSIIPNEKVTCAFRDVNGQTIEERSLTSNNFGTIEGFFSAPENVLTGNMTIQLLFSDARISHSVKVEEYKRPKIYAEVDTLKKPYVLGDVVKLGGVVKSFSGSSMAGAEVKYRVVREHRQFWYYYDYRGGQPLGSGQGKLMSSGNLLANENGRFELNVATEKGLLDERSYYFYKAYFDITDITGETTQVVKSFSLSDIPFQFTTNLPEQSFVEDLKEIYFEVKNIEGFPVAATVEVTVDELVTPEFPLRKRYWEKPTINLLDQKEFEARFPQYDFGRAFDENVKKENVLNFEQTDLEAPVLAFKELKKGFYKVKLVVTDNEGNVKEAVKYISLSDTKAPATTTAALWLSPLDKSYEVGQTLKLTLNAAYQGAYIFYRFSQLNDELEKGWLELNDKKIERAIHESDRGGMTLEIVMIKDNRVHTKSFNINVPWSNKSLEVVYENFRNKILPGANEEWKIRIKNKDGELQKAEILATLYDASLDRFVPHNWTKKLFPEFYGYNLYSYVGFGMANSYRFQAHQNFYAQLNGLRFVPDLNWFNYYPNFGSHGRNVAFMGDREMPQSATRSRMAKSMDASGLSEEANETTEFDAVTVADDGIKEAPATDAFAVRENLKETVFFYPQLTTENGEAVIAFKMNEALTQWNMFLMAHTQDLKYAFDVKQIVTQKELMIEPHMPRFVRQGDEVFLNAKVSNLSDRLIDIRNTLELFDFISDENLNEAWDIENVNIEETLMPGQSKNIGWWINVPKDYSGALRVVVRSNGGAYADGEQNIVPVLSNRKLVTESMAMHVSSKETKTFAFKAMEKMNASSSLDNYKYSVEITSNPSWLVLKTLPYLLDEQAQATTQLFDGWYGALIGHDLVSQDKDIQKVIQHWADTNDYKSQLNKNEGLKISSLEETPWVQDALREEGVMKALSIFLDENNVQNELKKRWAEIKKRQSSNGGFTWMAGGKDNWYITQYLLEGIGHLKQLGVVDDVFDKRMIDRAVKYSDDRLVEYYERMHDKDDEHIAATIVQFLYMRSYFMDVSIDSKVGEVIEYYLAKAEKHWLKLNTYQQAMLSLSLPQWKRQSLSDKIYKSLSEKMIINEALGYYWNDQAGYYWYQSNIEKQALMIELYKSRDVDQKVIDGLKLYLLKHKQVNSWKTSRATSAAVYAFMLDSEHWLAKGEEVEVYVGGDVKLNFDEATSFTGYGKKEFAGKEITESMEEIKVVNPNNHVAWGGAYWQYFEDLDAIQSFEDTPLKIVKNIFRVEMDGNGEVLNVVDANTELIPGDKLRIRIELKVDRPMEFIQMKDMRSSGLEPFNVLSQYKYQDGLSYYESTKDIATYFYFDFLPKGNFVFEYDVYAGHQGKFSNGITEIQSMYAPEFSSHSEGVSLKIGE